MSKASESMRADWSVNDAARDAGQKTPDNIIRFDNIQYGEDPQWNVLDVYKQKGSIGKMPLIIIVHGGGWVYGTKEIYQYYGMGLAQRGFAVINYNYRLAPEVKFPAPLEDTNNVIKWMYGNKEQYGFDTDRVCMVGDSAGAHLLGLYCAICTDSQYASYYDFKPYLGFLPKAIAMNCGAYRIYDENGNITDGSVNPELMEEDFLPEHGSEKEKKMINMINCVNKKFPAAYIMTAKGDFLIGQAPLLEIEYTKAGVECISKVYGDDNNPLYHVFHITMQEPLAQICNDEECYFFKRILSER